MNGSAPEARKSLFAKQGSFGGLNAAAASDVEGGGRLLDARNVEENIGEGGELFTEGIFTLSCMGEVEKVR